MMKGDASSNKKTGDVGRTARGDDKSPPLSLSPCVAASRQEAVIGAGIVSFAHSQLFWYCFCVTPTAKAMACVLACLFPCLGYSGSSSTSHQPPPICVPQEEHLRYLSCCLRLRCAALRTKSQTWGARKADLGKRNNLLSSSSLQSLHWNKCWLSARWRVKDCCRMNFSDVENKDWSVLKHAEPKMSSILNVTDWDLCLASLHLKSLKVHSQVLACIKITFFFFLFLQTYRSLEDLSKLEIFRCSDSPLQQSW